MRTIQMDEPKRQRPLGLRKMVGVMGPSNATDAQLDLGYAIGKIVALRDLVLLTGGLSGVMLSASQGAKEHAGLVVGLSPTGNRWDVNDYVDIAIPTSLGSGRNFMNICSCDAVIAIGSRDSAGTLSEIAFALQTATPLLVYTALESMRTFLDDFRALGQAEFGRSEEDTKNFLKRHVL